MEKKEKFISQEDIFKMLNNCYQKTLNGINKISPPIEKFAND